MEHADLAQTRSGLRRARIGARAAGPRAPRPPGAGCCCSGWPRRGSWDRSAAATWTSSRAPPEAAAALARARGARGRRRAAGAPARAGFRWPSCSPPRSGRRSTSQRQPLLRGVRRGRAPGPPAAALLRPRRRGAGARLADAPRRARSASCRECWRCPPPPSSPSPSCRCCGPTTSRPGRTCSRSSRCRSRRCWPWSPAPSSPTGPRACWPSAAIALASLFAAVGVWQAITHELFFYAPNLAVSNANTDFFRVTSLFGDPSLYGRHVVLGIGIVAHAAGHRPRARPDPARRPGADVGGAVLLLLAVEHGRAAARDARARVRHGRPAGAARGRTAGAGGRRGRARLRRGQGDRRRVGEPRHERPDRARRGRAAGHPRGPGAGRGHRRPAAGEPARRRAATGRPRTTCRTPPRSPSRPSSGRSGSCSTSGCSYGGARAIFEVWRSEPALGLALGASLLALFVHALFYSGFLEDPLTWFVLAVAAGWLMRPVPAEVARAERARVAGGRGRMSARRIGEASRRSAWWWC